MPVEPLRRERVTKAVSISTELVRWAEGQARRDNRSLSNFVETLLLEKQSAEKPDTAA